MEKRFCFSVQFNPKRFLGGNIMEKGMHVSITNPSSGAEVTGVVTDYDIVTDGWEIQLDDHGILFVPDATLYQFGIKEI